MSGCEAWEFDRDQLDLVLRRWHELDPPRSERDRMVDCIIDVRAEPKARGDHDPELDVWVARAHGTECVIVYSLRAGCLIWPLRIGPPDRLHPFPIEPT